MKDDKIVDCLFCGGGTTKIGTKLCDRCWELKTRIEANPKGPGHAGRLTRHRLVQSPGRERGMGQIEINQREGTMKSNKVKALRNSGIKIESISDIDLKQLVEALNISDPELQVVIEKKASRLNALLERDGQVEYIPLTKGYAQKGYLGSVSLEKLRNVEAKLPQCICDYPQGSRVSVAQREAAEGHFNQAGGYCCPHWGNTCGHCHQYA